MCVSDTVPVQVEHSWTETSKSPKSSIKVLLEWFSPYIYIKKPEERGCNAFFFRFSVITDLIIILIHFDWRNTRPLNPNGTTFPFFWLLFSSLAIVENVVTGPDITGRCHARNNSAVTINVRSIILLAKFLFLFSFSSLSNFFFKFWFNRALMSGPFLVCLLVELMMSSPPTFSHQCVRISGVIDAANL